MDGSDDTNLIGRGIYTIPQAARLASVPASAIRRWLFGYSYEYDGHRVQQPAVVAAKAELRKLRVVTFSDLIEIQFVQSFRQAGVSWRTIRLCAERASRISGRDHPFASREFVTDGRTIFAEFAQSTGNRELLDLRNNQLAFRRVFLPSLVSKLELGQLGVERLWPLGKSRPVVIDPERQFGQPITQDEGVPTNVLVRAFHATGSLAAVAKWYDVSRKAAQAAVQFEKRLAA